jgi:hypothetical protein
MPQYYNHTPNHTPLITITNNFQQVKVKIPEVRQTNRALFIPLPVEKKKTIPWRAMRLYTLEGQPPCIRPGTLPPVFFP